MCNQENSVHFVWPLPKTNLVSRMVENAEIKSHKEGRYKFQSIS